jgi:hypothetical protein
VKRWLPLAIAVLVATGWFGFIAIAATLSGPTPEWDGSTKAGDPAYQAAVVTASDSADVPFWCTALWVGGAGNLSVVMASKWVAAQTAGQATAAAVVFTAVNAGQWMPIRVSRVTATNTTATNIVCVSR